MGGDGVHGEISKDNFLVLSFHLVETRVTSD